MSTRFIITREHRRFTEFVDAVRRSCTIGLCFGPAGVGKTLSARRYAHWEQCHQLLTDWGPRTDNDARIYAALARRRTVLYTPSVLTTARALKDELDQAISRTNICIEQHLRPAAADRQEPWDWRRYTKKHVQLIIVDESERLAHTAMELLRDWYDRDNIALILIGMPWDDAGLLLFIRETRRAELGHWWALVGPGRQPRVPALEPAARLGPARRLRRGHQPALHRHPALQPPTSPGSAHGPNRVQRVRNSSVSPMLPRGS